MSAVMTETTTVAGPVAVGLASGSSPHASVQVRSLPREWTDEPSPERPDPVVDDPDTEELDLAALLVAAATPTATMGTPASGALARMKPARLPASRVRPPLASAPRDITAPPAPARGRRLARESTVAELGRLGLHLLLAALPLLAISAQVFGIVDMNISAGLLVLPLTAIMVASSLLRPVSSDRIVVAGMVWGLLATVVYDGFRLDTVYLLGWWGDFIPEMGTWLIHADPSHLGAGAVAGYVWRYLGDGGGIGVVFFVAAAATGLRRLGPRVTVMAAVGFAVFPVWSGLIATVALSSRGQSMMFPLTPTTIVLSLIGHLIFGVVLGLGAVRCEAIDTAWPWPPLLEYLERRPGRGAAVAWGAIPPTGPCPADPLTGPERPVPSAGVAAADPRIGARGRRHPTPLTVSSARGTSPGSPPPRRSGRPVDEASWPGSSARGAAGVALLAATRASGCSGGPRRRSMSPFAHHRHGRGRRPRSWPAPRATLALLAAALLVASGLLGGPALVGAPPTHAALTLLDDTTGDTTSDDTSSGNTAQSGDQASDNQGGNNQSNDKNGGRDGKTRQQRNAGGNTNTAAGDSADFAGRDKIGKAGPEQYVAFDGFGAGAADATGSGGTAAGSETNSAGSGATGSSGVSSGASSSGGSGATGATGPSAGTSPDGTTSGGTTSSATGTGAGTGVGTGTGIGTGTGGSDPGAGATSSGRGTGVVSEEAKSTDKNKNNDGSNSNADNKNNGNDAGNGGDKNDDGSGNQSKNNGDQSGDASAVDDPGAVNLADKENPQGGEFSAGSYSIRCSLSNHRNSDNPLLAPGKVNGAQHAHDYAGNNSANASSNTDTLEQSSTTCTNGDQSPVFWPVLRDLNGVGDDVGEDGGSLDGNVGSIIEPTAIDLTFHGHGTRPVKPMPLTMVLNDGAAKSATENGKGANAKYTCSGSRQLTDLYPLCPPGTAMQRVFDFPSCWNGRNTDSADHISHIVFPDPDGNCEADEVPVPALRLTLSYPAVQSRTFAIDSFPQEQHNPITDHALMEYLSSERRAAQGAACINARQRCVQGPANNPGASNNGAGANGAAANGSGVGFLDPQDRVPPSRNFAAALATHAEGHDHYSVDLPGAPTLGRLLGAWQLDVLFAVVLVLLISGYTAGIVLARRRGRGWSRPRTAAWATGCAVILLASCSGWARYAEAMFSVHMAQHMALLMVAPMLLALGAPVTLACTAAPRLAARVAARLGRIPRVALHPAVVLAGVLAADWGLYFSGLFSATLTYHWTHSLLDLAVLLLGGLFAYTVLGVDPAPVRRGLPSRLGLLLAAMPAHVGFALAVGDDPQLLSASFYRVLYLRWVPSVIADQHTGGAVAAAVGELGLLLALVALLAGAAAGGALSGPYGALTRRVAAGRQITT